MASYWRHVGFRTFRLHSIHLNDKHALDKIQPCYRRTSDALAIGLYFIFGDRTQETAV